MTKKFTDWIGDFLQLPDGDCLYVVSDLLELAKTEKEAGRKLDLDELTECLQGVAGTEGTLLLPAFNWDFCRGIGFDYRKTPARTGALPKAALKRADFARTQHPLYSFAVWGAKRAELLDISAADSFGRGTIFEKMYEWDVKVLVIGLGALAGVTYIHHVEQMTGVPYRYHKEFTADYTDAEGHCEKRTYRMYVRDLEKDPRHIDGFKPLEEEMRRRGLIRTAEFGTVDCHFLTIRDLDSAVRKDILENDSRRMYRYNGQS